MIHRYLLIDRERRISNIHYQLFSLSSSSSSPLNLSRSFNRNNDNWSMPRLCFLLEEDHLSLRRKKLFTHQFGLVRSIQGLNKLNFSNRTCSMIRSCRVDVCPEVSLLFLQMLICLHWKKTEQIATKDRFPQVDQSFDRTYTEDRWCWICNGISWWKISEIHIKKRANSRDT